jgi:SAM-dependent methyltransferase
MRPEDRLYVQEIISKKGLTAPVLDACVGAARSLYEDLFPKDSYFRHDLAKQNDSIDMAADICSMPDIPDNLFGTVINFWGLEHIRNPFMAIDEMHRVLKVNGILLLAVPLYWRVHRSPQVKDYWRFCPDGLALLLKSFSLLDLRVDGCRGESEWDLTSLDYRTWKAGSTGIYAAAMKM